MVQRMSITAGDTLFIAPKYKHFGESLYFIEYLNEISFFDNLWPE